MLLYVFLTKGCMYLLKCFHITEIKEIFFPHKHHILTHDFVSVLHLISTAVYQRGQASPSLILWPPRNRQNLHHPCLCQAAVQGQRVQLHGVGSTLQLHNKLIVSWHGKASASYPAVNISSSSEIKLCSSLIYFLTNFIFQLNASDDRGIDVVRGPILSFASTRTIFK